MAQGTAMKSDPISAGQTHRGRVHRPGKLRVYQQWQTGPHNMRQRRPQSFLGHHGEAIDPGMNQEALESQLIYDEPNEQS